MKILVTGATGYIGGRLVPLLLERGHDVRVLVRDPQRIARRPWLSKVGVAVGDLFERATVSAAANGMDAAYYLVHSMVEGRDYAERDRAAAKSFCQAAQGLGHVVYLGGLMPGTSHVSQHLKSRAEVGEILRAGFKATELRAGPIIGSGSAAFELLRYIVKRIPLVLAPSGVNHEIQPISVRDILSYLVLAVVRQPGGVIDVGSDRLSFLQMMKVIAEVAGYKRSIISTPFVTPGMAAIGANLMTPLPKSLAMPLVQGVVHPLLADSKRAEELFPEVKPITYRRAVELALGRIARADVETSWTGALGSAKTYELKDWEGIAREIRSAYVDAPPKDVFRMFTSLGGDRGWLVWNWAWRWRGRLDKLIGGPGLRRGRRDPADLLPGEALDFWRVERIDPPSLLRLRAEMKVPGKAWLQWEAIPEGEGTRLVQSALFEPSGVWGTLYWYMLYPIHKFIFSDLINAISRESAGAGVVQPGGESAA